ncbi:MAG: amidohydrolase [Flavobacteriales bacterium]|nr:amidohydrolase [Flavobacteriales bacterium]
MRSHWALWSTLFTMIGCTYRSEKADLVIHNAVIHTMDAGNDLFQAMAIRDGRILELGPEHQILNKYKGRSYYDAAGSHVYPGFIDAHCHFYGYGLNAQKVDLVGTSDWDEVLERTQHFAHAHPEKTWIIGRGWDQNDWPEVTDPDRTELDRLFPDRPVLLQRVDGHAAVVNQAAMDRVGLAAGDHVEGGLLVERDDQLTGLLLDNAVAIFETIMEEADETTKRTALLHAQQAVFQAGLTSVCDAGLDIGTIELIRSMQGTGELKVRVHAMVSESPEALAHYAQVGMVNEERLTVRCIKVYADGALGSRGALLKEPYHDKPEHFGLQLRSREHLSEVAEWCIDHGFQMATHCIGDSANKLMLDIYGTRLKGSNDRRWRIEHAQVVDPADRDQFAAWGVIPSVQPTHATSDAPWAEARLGADRMNGAYAYRSLMEQLGLLALGTDFPVEAIDPLGTFRSAVFRQDAHGDPVDGFRLEEALTREEALRGMTIWNAISLFREADLGSLEPGKLADLVILDHDLLNVGPDQIGSVEVQATFVNGEKVY